MSSITELMKGKVPGKVRVRHINWNEDSFFTPYYSACFGWKGLNESEQDSWNSDGVNWVLYEPPPPKVKKWLWAREDGVISSTLRTEAVVHPGWTKLEWSETLIEEDKECTKN